MGLPIRRKELFFPSKNLEVKIKKDKILTCINRSPKIAKNTEAKTNRKVESFPWSPRREEMRGVDTLYSWQFDWRRIENCLMTFRQPFLVMLISKSGIINFTINSETKNLTATASPPQRKTFLRFSDKTKGEQQRKEICDWSQKTCSC